ACPLGGTHCLTLDHRFDRLHAEGRAAASKRASMAHTRRPKPTWVVVGTLSLSRILTSLQHTMIIAQLPHVPNIYTVSPDYRSSGSTVSLLQGATATTILSSRGGMYGKTLLRVLSTITRVAGSLMVILPFGFAGLIIGRGLQGTSTGLIPIAMSIMRDEL